VCEKFHFIIYSVTSRWTCSSRATCCPWHRVTLLAETFERGISLLTLPLSKLRQNAEEVLKTNEPCICADIHYITNSFCKNVLKYWHPGLSCELHFYTVLLFLQYSFIAYDFDIYIGRNVHIILCILTHYLFCVLNFMLPTCRTNLLKLPTSHKVWAGQL